ncbi:hypothetical protein, partial [Massilia glaciei]|uniref:hypothetical protein n=1 Tax=Massilia glaciei TaxID=1524097 RepID=UPI001C626A6C
MGKIDRLLSSPVSRCPNLAHARHYSCLVKEVKRLRQIAMAKGFQGRLMDMAVPSLEEMAHYSFHYHPGQYPARQMYKGS